MTPGVTNPGRAKVLWVRVVQRRGDGRHQRPCPLGPRAERRRWPTNVNIARSARDSGSAWNRPGNTIVDGDAPLPLAGWRKSPCPVGRGRAGNGVARLPRLSATQSPPSLPQRQGGVEDRLQFLRTTGQPPGVSVRVLANRREHGGRQVIVGAFSMGWSAVGRPLTIRGDRTGGARRAV